MAYVVWRVFMKKYCKVRLGVNRHLPAPPTAPPPEPINPVERPVSSVDNRWDSKPLEPPPPKTTASNTETPAASESRHLESNEEVAGGFTQDKSIRKSSKAQRVKSYLKKCKDAALGTASPSVSEDGANASSELARCDENRNRSSKRLSNQSNSKEVSSNTCWYVAESFETSDVGNQIPVVEIKTPDDDEDGTLHFEDATVGTDQAEDALTVTFETCKVGKERQKSVCLRPDEDDDCREVTCVTGSLPVCSSSRLRGATSAHVSISTTKEGKCGTDVASLVDRYLGHLYTNFDRSRPVLVRQARDLLVCTFHGNLTAFEREFLAPAAALLQNICQAAEKDGRDAVAPRGWPLCLGDHGVTLQLGELDPTLLRNRDCYLCVGGRFSPSSSSVAVALVWRYEGRLGKRIVSDDLHALETPVTLDMAAADVINDADAGNLSGLLQSLLVSVERAIERVPLDDLAFPCPQCHAYLLPTDYPEDSVTDDNCGCQCSCKQVVVQKKDTSMQTSPMFEFAGSIPHIDSDEDEDGYTGNYTRKTSQDSGIQTSTASTMTTPTTATPQDELVPPKSITHLPDKLLLSGIHLPGTHDIAGRSLVLYDTLCVSRASLNHHQIATTILYYSTIPSAETVAKGLTVLVVSGPAESSALALLDKAFFSLAKHVKVGNVLLWRQDKVQSKWQKKTNILERSQIQYHVVADDAELRNFLPEDQVPATCGGRSNHDQLEWVEFHKELEPFLAQCHDCGRRLVGAMTELRTSEAQGHVTRRQLHHQHRALSRAINAPELHRLRREGAATLGRLEQRAQWLPASQHVRLALERARCMFAEVDRASRRLEELSDGRRERLRELARVRALEDETEQVLSWLCKKGDDTLARHAELATSLQAIKQQEHDFEKFYFISMRHLDKGSDLVEAAGQCTSETRSDGARGSLKDLARALKQHLRGFGERLEDTRERLEDTSRCFYLLDKAYEWALETMKYLSRVGVVEEVQTPDQAMQMLKMIQQYLMAHPSLSEDHFQEMLQLAAKLGNDKLQQQAKVAHSRCQETMETIRTQQSRLVQLRRMLGGEDDRPTSPKPTHQGWKTATSTPIGAVGRRRSVGSNPYIYKCSHHAAGHSCSCWDPTPTPSPLEDCCCGNNSRNNLPFNLGNIQEVRESAEDLLDAAEESNSDKREELCGRCSEPVDSQSNVLSKRQLRRSCTWQYPTENFDEERLCDGDDNSGDNTTEGSEGCAKSGDNGDDLDEQEMGNKCVPPVPVNSHLHCNASTLDLSNSLAVPGTTQHKAHKTLLYIMREMIQTERDYVKSLEYIIENYIPELLREDIPQALRGQRNVIFGNVEKIYEFHSQYFLQELEKCENSPLQIGQSFLRHEKKFYLYALYNKNKPKSDAIMSEYGTSFFKAKQVELGDKMDLASYLLKPVQRMGKYALLLQQLIKACSDKVAEGDKECVVEKGPEVDTTDMKAADKMVRFQLRHGNDLLAMDSLRDCDVNVKEQGRLLRQNEFLVWQGKGKKCLRHVFLFEELILFSKARRFPDRKNLDLYIYKNSIKMTDIGLTAKIGDSPTKFEIWFRKRKPNDTFTLQTMSEEIKQAWTEELSKLLWKQALRNRESRLAEMSSMGIGNKPCLDIRPSKDQINDRSISFAQLSKTAPRFRNSITVPPGELLRSNKRPHSIISVSSSSSSGGSSTSHSSNYGALINLGFDPADSPRLHHRSATLNSQCSMESGIIADISLGSEDTDSSGTHWCVERSNSSATSTSLDSAASPTSPTEEGGKPTAGDAEQSEFYIKL